MDIVVTGRNVEVPAHYRTHVADKLAKTERYDSKIIRVEVELAHETNRRQSKNCQRVQITLISKGPAVRAEDAGETFYSALDGAVDKLESRLRRAAERRHDKRTDRTPIAAVATPAEVLLAEDAPAVDQPLAEQLQDDASAYQAEDLEPGRIVRIKDHPAVPISVDEALFQMELVGHDFYLFVDAATGQPSAVYRRRGWTYGVISLDQNSSDQHEPVVEELAYQAS